VTPPSVYVNIAAHHVGGSPPDRFDPLGYSQENKAVQGALEGIRVIDLTIGMAGPLAAMLLADHGAEVLKVEPPEGDPARSRPGFHVWNRGKQAVVVDSSLERDTASLAALSSRADVIFVGTARPGFTYDDMQRLGVAGPAPLVVVLPPYLLGHTPWPSERESAGLLFADLGHAWNQGSYRDVPVDCIYPLSLYLQGSWAATVAVACLLGPTAGRGQTITVGGAHGALLGSPGAFMTRRGRPHVHRPGGPGGVLPNYRCYRCRDGTWLFFGAFTNGFIGRAISVLEAHHVLDDSRVLGDLNAIRNPENVEWITLEFERIFQQRARAEWIAAFSEANVPVAAVLSRDSWLDHPQVQALGQRLKLTDDSGGQVVMPGVPVCLEDTPGAVRSTAPSTGQPIAMLKDFWSEPREGHDSDGIASANTASADDAARPLLGTSAVDFGTIIAGPYIGSLLAELGADVVKVERPPFGDEFRTAHGGRGGSAYPAYNRGQRGLAVDLQHPEGRALVERLLGRSDVVIDNFRPGVVERLGIDRRSLATTNPGVITVSVSTFGDRGPLGSQPGFDPLIQAMSGIMRAQGGLDEADSPAFLTVPICDVMASVLSAFGVCVAMVARRRTGRGQRVTVPLVAVSCLLQSEQLVRVAGRSPSIVGGRDFPGAPPLQRFYEAKDGFIRLDASSPADIDSLVRAGFIGREAGATSDEGLLTEVLSAEIATLRTSEVVERLSAFGLAAVRARTYGEVACDETLIRHGLLEIVSRNDAGDVEVVGPGRGRYVVGSDVGPLPEAPRLGEHSREILAELGLEPGRIDELVSSGVVLVDGQSDP
jgi:crotonobetainyl-CoA:carnitine CoA-transferase CaiB-like acyl-CoA transferase